jgi:hypothetical protein
MKFRMRYALASLTALLAFSAASQAQSNPPTWNATEAYKVGDLVSYEGVTFQCLINETTVHPNPHTLSWGINYVYSGVVPIPVGPSEPIKTLTQAWTYIAGARISNNSSIVIELDANYSESFSTSFSLDHPFGSKISIVGKFGALATFSAVAAGFTLDSNHSFADLEGLEMVGPGSGTQGYAAIQTSQNSCLSKLQNMTIENFDIGLSADTGSTIDNVASIGLSQFLQGGFYASAGAVINVTTPLTIDGSATSSPSPPGFAFEAFGGTINCYKCKGNNCEYNFWARDGGKIEAPSSTSTSKPGALTFGYSAVNRGFINASSTTSTTNAYGFDSNGGGFIDATGSTSTTSATADYFASSGGGINAQYNHGGTTSVGTNDSSYILGF